MTEKGEESLRRGKKDDEVEREKREEGGDPEGKRQDQIRLSLCAIHVISTKSPDFRTDVAPT